ncbi:hypothetical protein AVEN_1781-1, partial [Araneus ventricosus]
MEKINVKDCWRMRGTCKVEWNVA